MATDILPAVDTAVFLDRDNTLIANDGDLGDPDAVRLLDGVAEGLRALREAGYRLVVVTNQGGVARGRFSEDDVDAVHERIATLAEETARTHDLINRFYYCPYHPEATVDAYRRDHPWRKPHPGMLLQAARDLNLDLSRSWMVGDQPRDIQAGRAAGCRTVLLGTANGTTRPTATAGTFREAVETILRSTPARRGGNGIAAPSEPSPAPDPTLQSVHVALSALTEELRARREDRLEFGGMRLAAGMVQLLAVLFAVLAMLQMADGDLFVRWMLGAVLAQLFVIAALLFDHRA